MGDLSIQNLTVEYASGADTVRPIDGLNLDVAAGSLVILMGPSGCGKTTLLSCLGGILRPSAGAIKFGDVDVTSLGAKALSKYRRVSHSSSISLVDRMLWMQSRSTPVDSISRESSVRRSPLQS